jgi:ATP-binding protein involved in chromosome partitioning
MKNVISVASGKGGVGKSTVAVNLAVTLAKRGAKVALIDSDMYGPSIPTLMGGGQIFLDNEQKVVPPENFGVKYISIGFFLAEPDSPIIWRGPMFTKMLTQLFRDVRWGQVDVCILDMPPGTGDAQITLAQMPGIDMAGSVVVTTPQEVALADVRKAIKMFERVNIPVIGLVENMAGFTLPDGTVVPIFGEGGGARLSEEYDIPLLASIPVDLALREGGDQGQPVCFAGGTATSKLFDALAVSVENFLAEREDEGVSIINS